MMSYLVGPFENLRKGKENLQLCIRSFANKLSKGYAYG